MCTVQKNEMIHDLIILVDLLYQQTSLRISVQTSQWRSIGLWLGFTSIMKTVTCCFENEISCNRSWYVPDHVGDDRSRSRHARNDRHRSRHARNDWS